MPNDDEEPACEYKFLVEDESLSSAELKISKQQLLATTITTATLYYFILPTKKLTENTRNNFPYTEPSIQ